MREKQTFCRCLQVWGGDTWEGVPVKSREEDPWVEATATELPIPEVKN